MRLRRTPSQIARAQATLDAYLLNWHQSYAWLPHRTSTGWVWLDWAERCGYWVGIMGSCNRDIMLFQWRKMT